MPILLPPPSLRNSHLPSSIHYLVLSILTSMSTTPRWNENANWTPRSDANKGVLLGCVPSPSFAHSAGRRPRGILGLVVFGGQQSPLSLLPNSCDWLLGRHDVALLQSLAFSLFFPSPEAQFQASEGLLRHWVSESVSVHFSAK